MGINNKFLTYITDQPTNNLYLGIKIPSILIKMGFRGKIK